MDDVPLPYRERRTNYTADGGCSIYDLIGDEMVLVARIPPGPPLEGIGDPPADQRCTGCGWYAERLRARGHGAWLCEACCTSDSPPRRRPRQCRRCGARGVPLTDRDHCADCAQGWRRAQFRFLAAPTADPLTDDELVDRYLRVTDMLTPHTIPRSRRGRRGEFRDRAEFRAVMIDVLVALLRRPGRKGALTEAEAAEYLSTHHRGRGNRRAGDDHRWDDRQVRRWCNEVYHIPFDELVAAAYERVRGSGG